MFLNAAELLTLTGRRRPLAQAVALKRMGIRHSINAAGHVVVLRAHVERRLDGTTTPEPFVPDFTDMEA